MAKIVKTEVEANSETLIELRHVTKTLKALNDIEFIILGFHETTTPNDHSEYYKAH